MEKSLLFYDLETSGLNMCFDQPLEFAAVRTDYDLNEIERTHFFIKLREDVIPSPEAVLITGFDINNQPKNAKNELEAARIIHKMFNLPQTVSLGYNSLGFDDEFLRFMFYRNLLPPYTHQFNNGCGRADLFPIVIVYYLFHTDIMQWRQAEQDASLKLDNLGGLNGFFAGQAHSALNDTLAALQMARLFKAKQPKTWEYLLGRFNKDIDRDEIMKLREEGAAAKKPVVGYAVDSRYGYAKNFTGLVLDIGESKAYKNQTLWLRLDSENMRETGPENLSETSMVIRKRLGDLPFILPPYPRYGAKIDAARAKLEYDNLQWLLDNPQIFGQICEYHRNFRYPVAVNVDCDAMLYVDGFISKADSQWCQRFHDAPLKDKSALLGQLQSPSLQNLGLRALGRNYYQALAPHEQACYNAHLASVNALNAVPPNDYRNTPRLTIARALEQIETLRAGDISDGGKKLLNNLASALKTRGV